MNSTFPINPAVLNVGSRYSYDLTDTVFLLENKNGTYSNISGEDIIAKVNKYKDLTYLVKSYIGT